MYRDHEFLLLDRHTQKPADYLQHIGRPDAVRLHDDLLDYVNDSLKWIPSQNPAKNDESQKGLNFYGPTMISQASAGLLNQVLLAWAGLFSLGPREIRLTGCWESVEGEPAIEGSYAEVIIDRDEVVQSLKTVAEWARQVATGPDDLYILHLGI